MAVTLTDRSHAGRAGLQEAVWVKFLDFRSEPASPENFGRGVSGGYQNRGIGNGASARLCYPDLKSITLIHVMRGKCIIIQLSFLFKDIAFALIVVALS